MQVHAQKLLKQHREADHSVQSSCFTYFYSATAGRRAINASSPPCVCVSSLLRRPLGIPSQNSAETVSKTMSGSARRLDVETTRLIGRGPVLVSGADGQTRRPSTTTHANRLVLESPIDVRPGLGGRRAATRLFRTIHACRLERRLVASSAGRQDARFSAATGGAKQQRASASAHQVGYWRL